MHILHECMHILVNNLQVIRKTVCGARTNINVKLNYFPILLSYCSTIAERKDVVGLDVVCL